MADVHDQYADGEVVAAGASGSTSATKGFNPLATEVNNSVKKDTVTTKGDIYVRNATVVTRQAVGSNDQILTADSAQATGVKWADPAGGYEFIAQNTTGVKTATTGSFVTLLSAVIPSGFVEILVSAVFLHERAHDGTAPGNSRFGVFKILTDTPTSILDNGTTLGTDRATTIQNFDPNIASGSEPYANSAEVEHITSTSAFVRYVPTAGETSAGFTINFQGQQDSNSGDSPSIGCGMYLVLGKT